MSPTDAPEPTRAERARTLVHGGRVATLSTHSRRLPGFPFGSVTPYGVDPQGQPTLLISRLAMHTQNLSADPRASVLILESVVPDAVLARGRVTLLGTATAVSEPDLPPLREDYLARHPESQRWFAFDDFALYRIAVIDVYYVAGFGAMGWIDSAAYHAAVTDPLADHAAAIVAHMNLDHADTLRLYCRTYGGVEATAAIMATVDHLGFTLQVHCGEQEQSLRLAFPQPVRTPEDARAALIAMARTARAATETR